MVLEPEMTYAAAGRLHAALLARIAAPEVVLDAAAVARMSTAAVLAVVGYTNARGDLPAPAVAPGASQAFVDAFSDLGLFAELMRLDFRA